MKHVSYNIIITDASPQDSASLQKTQIILMGGGGGVKKTKKSKKISSANVPTIVVFNRSTPLPAFGIRS